MMNAPLKRLAINESACETGDIPGTDHAHIIPLIESPANPQTNVWLNRFFIGVALLIAVAGFWRVQTVVRWQEQR